ncbi:MAG: hypothetical protein ACI8RD_011038, partial [Bacillariaceae sp.]
HLIFTIVCGLLLIDAMTPTLCPKQDLHVSKNICVV